MHDPHLLPAAQLALSRRDDGALVLQRDGQSMPLAPPRRALPLSEPDKFIVLSDADGQELGVLRDVAELDAASQAVLREELNRAYTIERITRVLEVEREALTGQTRWRVEIASENSEANESEEIATTLNQSAAASNGIAPTKYSTSANSASQDGVHDAANASPEKDDTKMLERLKLRLRSDRADGPDNDIATEEREFLISGQEDVQTARYPHIYIVDTERNRYEIPDCEALDLESRHAAERFF